MPGNKEKPLGALWLKEGANGQFFSGVIELEGQEKINVVVFPNSYKSDAKQPDFKIFRALKRDAGPAQPKAPPAPSDEIPPLGDEDAPPFV